MAEQRDNSGAIFRVDNPKSDRHPPYSGKATVGGVDYYMDAWVNETKDGKKYFAVKFKPREPAAPKGEESQVVTRPDEDRECPF